VNTKNAQVCLSIAAVLTLCVPNVVAARANNQTTETHISYAMSASDKGTSKLILLLGKNTTTVNSPVNIYGTLATDEQGT